MLHSLTPHFILDELAAGRTAGRFDGICVFVDIAGFTPLTLALMEHGSEGAEVLAEVLMRVFAPLIEIVYDQGGWIAGFAGDAFKAVFPCHAESARGCVRQSLPARGPGRVADPDATGNRASPGDAFRDLRLQRQGVRGRRHS